MVEAHTFGRKAVEMRGDHDVVAGTAHDVGAVLICVEEQEVRFLRCGPAHSKRPSHEMIPCLSRMPLDLYRPLLG